MKRRVVITGLSTISPAGLTIQRFWDTLTRGRSVVKPISKFNSHGFETRMAGEIANFNVKDYKFPFMLTRQLDLFCQYALAATEDLFENAGVDLERMNKDRVGIFVGNCLGGVGFGESELYNLYRRGWSEVSQFQATAWFYAAIQGQVSIYYKLKGMSKTYTADRISSDAAIGNAWRAILLDRIDCAVAGGSEAGLYPYGYVGYCAANLFSRNNENPESAYRPFCIDADGIVLGEGACFLLLETLEHAKARNAPIYGELLAQVSNCDGYHHSKHDPKGKGLERAIRSCLERAELQAERIDYINLDGMARRDDDIREANALKSVFGKRIKAINMSCPKVTYGHTFGAAGAFDAATNCLVLRDGIIPPTINCENLRDDLGIDVTPNKSLEKDVNYTMQIATGRGGLNSAMLIVRYNK
ncbi:MAG: hypothetical protein GF344_14530 [Chitinivibrionales bacterium]|nr:hypothetical protein [Chitinivibrionales bacterium]